MIRQKEMDGGQLMSRAWREQQIVSSPVIMFSSFPARNEIQHASFYRNNFCIDFCAQRIL